MLNTAVKNAEKIQKIYSINIVKIQKKYSKNIKKKSNHDTTFSFNTWRST